MSQYFPEATILNRVHIPYYTKPERIKLLGPNLDIETGPDGLSSVIRLSDFSGNPVYPYIDLSRFDIESKHWLWYDSDELPYRVTKNSASYIEFEPLYPKIGDLTYEAASLDLKEYIIERQKYFITGRFGPADTREFRSYDPIIVQIEGESLKDLTDYNTKFVNPFSIDSTINKEFYFDFDRRIYTNQNLTSFNLEKLFVWVYVLPNTVSVKARLRSNGGRQSHATPVVDHYIVKLNGQVL